MNRITKTLVLAVVVTLGYLGNAPSAYAAITIIVAEVRGEAAYVKGSDAGRKQQIFWQGGLVTKANGKGNFSFEGILPTGCPPNNCVGMLTAGATTMSVPLAYQPGEPPNQVDDELELKLQQLTSHSGDAVRAVGFVEVGFVENEPVVQVVSGGADARLRYWTLDLNQTPVGDLSLLWDNSLPNIIYDLDVWTDVGETSIVATGEGGWKGHAGSETLRIWNASGFPLTATQVPIGFVYSVAYSPLGLLAASGFYGDVVMYTGDLVLQDTTATKKKRTQALAFSRMAAWWPPLQLRGFSSGRSPRTVTSVTVNSICS